MVVPACAYVFVDDGCFDWQREGEPVLDPKKPQLVEALEGRVERLRTDALLLEGGTGPDHTCRLLVEVGENPGLDTVEAFVEGAWNRLSLTTRVVSSHCS